MPRIRHFVLILGLLYSLRSPSRAVAALTSEG